VDIRVASVASVLVGTLPLLRRRRLPLRRGTNSSATKVSYEVGVVLRAERGSKARMRPVFRRMPSPG